MPNKMVSTRDALRMERRCARVFPHFDIEVIMPNESERPLPNYDPFPPGQSSRSMVIELDVEDMGNMLQRAFVDTHGKFTIYCDEPPGIGGNSTAPAPLHYFAASIVF